MIDEIDAKILDILRENARIPNADIARQVGMAPSAVLERVRKLEDRGIIRGYTTVLNPAKLGVSVLAFILVRTKAGCWQADTGEKLAAFPEVEEVHHIAGEDCFLVKVRVADTNALGALLRERFTQVGTIGATRTTIVLETVKDEAGPRVQAQVERKSSRRAS